MLPYSKWQNHTLREWVHLKHGLPHCVLAWPATLCIARTNCWTHRRIFVKFDSFEILAVHIFYFLFYILFVELSTDFDLKFHNSTQSDLIEVIDVTSRDLSAVSVSLWMRSRACAAGFIMTKLSTSSDTAIEIRNPANLQLKLLRWWEIYWSKYCVKSPMGTIYTTQKKLRVKNILCI